MARQLSSFWLTPKGLAALGLIGAASYFLLVEHQQHVWQFLPYLILLACPLMHLFMHGGHGGHGHHHDASERDAYRRGFDAGRRGSAQEGQHGDREENGNAR